MPMRPIKTEMNGKPETLACLHWRTFPPLASFSLEDAEALRQAGDITDTSYQRMQVWERVCKLQKMDEDTCRKCPHVCRVETSQAQPPALVSLDGKKRTPIMDQTLLASLPHFRSHLMTTRRRPGTKLSKQNAAWVDNAAREREKGKADADG